MVLLRYSTQMVLHYILVLLHYVQEDIPTPNMLLIGFTTWYLVLVAYRWFLAPIMREINIG